MVIRFVDAIFVVRDAPATRRAQCYYGNTLKKGLDPKIGQTLEPLP